MDARILVVKQVSIFSVELIINRSVSANRLFVVNCLCLSIYGIQSSQSIHSVETNLCASFIREGECRLYLV